MKLILAIAGLLTAFIAGAYAQSKEPTECPMVTINGPAGIVDPGKIATFAVNVDTNGEKLTLFYEWAVSAGRIVSGQGTRSIDVLIPDVGSSITAQVEIKGLPLGCPNTFSEWIGCGLRSPDPIKIDEIAGPLTRISNERFVRVFDEMKRDRSAQLYVIIYGNPPSIKKKRDNFLQRIGALGRDDERLMRMTLVESVSRIDRVDMWLVPPGASNPTPEAK